MTSPTNPPRPETPNLDRTTNETRAAFLAWHAVPPEHPDYNDLCSAFGLAATEAGFSLQGIAFDCHTAAFAELDAAHAEALEMKADMERDEGTEPLAAQLGTPWRAYPGTSHIVSALDDETAQSAYYIAKAPDATNRAYIIAAVNACADAGLPLHELTARGLEGLCERQRNHCEANARWELDDMAELERIIAAIQGAPLVTAIAPPAASQHLGFGAEPDEGEDEIEQARRGIG